MRAHIALFLMLAACDGSAVMRASNDPIARVLHRGMTESQVAEASNRRSPDRVIMRTCGTSTSTPFTCKVFVYDTAKQVEGSDSSLWVVFEDVEGQWKVRQWL